MIGLLFAGWVESDCTPGKGCKYLLDLLNRASWYCAMFCLMTTDTIWCGPYFVVFVFVYLKGRIVADYLPTGPQ